MPIDNALKVKSLMENIPRMRKPVLAASIAVLLSLVGSNADALSLGRLTVQSALGQPLRAEIDIPEINAEEAETLKGAVASAEAFKATGLEFNPAINNLQVTLQRRADGKMFLKLSGDRVVNEPFVDLILEATWSSGRILRDYTLLFDPPSLREVAAPTAPQVTANVAAPVANTPPAHEASAPAPKPKVQRPAVAAAPATPVEKAPAATARQITVHPGDTASKIAGAHKAASVSLDQMLVALLRSNPDAFTANNINRLKSGAVLDLPTSEQAQETSRDAATQTVLAQSKDFNDFRNHLATAAPATAPSAVARQATGKVQAQVEDKKSTAATPDKLTLSKPTAPNKAVDDRIAAERLAKDAAARTAELSRNIAELNKVKVGVASAPAAPMAAASTAATAKPIAPAIETKPALTVATPLAAVTSAPASAPTPAQVTASKPAAPKPLAKTSTPAPASESSFLDDVLENPLILGGALAIAGLLAGFAVYRTRRNKKSGTGESSFLDSHLQPDSFFGASGGEQVDTSNDSVVSGGSSMIYSPSQLDASGEVDPVAEADVYLAYGRDQQAEDILRDALHTTPSRVAIHAKLADIYAKRADIAAFNANAGAAYAVSQGQGAEWEHICDLGRDLDRENALYQADRSVAGEAESESRPIQAEGDAKPAEPVDLDLDFDLDFAAKAQAVPMDHQPSVMGVLHESDSTSEPIALYEAPPSGLADDPHAAVAVAGSTAVVAAPVAADADVAPAIEPELPTPTFSEPSAPPKIKSQTATSSAPSTPPEMLSFDLGALSLDLEPATAAPAAAAEEADTDTLDPLATKLALAREFQSIGDNDGAHALAEEVYTLASGQLRTDAKRFLSELGFAQSNFAQPPL